MADATTNKPEKTEPVEERTYAEERLIAEAQDFFGVRPSVVAGALAEGPKKNYTRAEVEKRIKHWLGD